VTFPLDVTKTRMQTITASRLPAHVSGWIEFLSLSPQMLDLVFPLKAMITTAMDIVRHEGILRLWQGISPALLRNIVYGGEFVCEVHNF